MTEILNERGRARAGGPERAAQACLQPNAIGENAGESARGPQVLWAHSVRTGERGRARAGGASLLAAERDWRERRMCDDTFAVAVDLTHLKTKHARMRTRASQSGRRKLACSRTRLARTQARTRASHKFDGRTRCAPENEW
jgi:hypothetical protein